MNYVVDIIRKNNKLVREILLYGIIGATSAMLDFIIYYYLVDSINIFIANSISITAGITLSFLLNTFVNFKVSDNLMKRALSFYSIGYIGLFISNCILFIGVSVLSFDNLYVKIFTVFFVAGVQFILNKMITFRKSKKEEKLNG